MFLASRFTVSYFRPHFTTRIFSLPPTASLLNLLLIFPGFFFHLSMTCITDEGDITDNGVV